MYMWNGQWITHNYKLITQTFSLLAMNMYVYILLPTFRWKFAHFLFNYTAMCFVCGSAYRPHNVHVRIHTSLCLQQHHTWCLESLVQCNSKACREGAYRKCTVYLLRTHTYILHMLVHVCRCTFTYTKTVLFNRAVFQWNSTWLHPSHSVNSLRVDCSRYSVINHLYNYSLFRHFSTDSQSVSITELSAWTITRLPQQYIVYSRSTWHILTPITSMLAVSPSLHCYDVYIVTCVVNKHIGLHYSIPYCIDTTLIECRGVGRTEVITDRSLLGTSHLTIITSLLK